MIRWLTALMCAAWLVCAAGPVPAQVADVRAPEPDPPVIELDAPEAPSAATLESFMAPSATPSTEWPFHKTADGLHPDGNEQRMVWLMNRARSNPTQEGTWLAAVNGENDDIAAARPYWGVNTAALQAAFAAIAARPPAAFDVRLYNAAKAHSEYLISTDTQSHTGQFTRVDSAGFKYTAAAGVVFSYSNDSLYGHAAFNIDWGAGPNGMQDPPGHRNALMSVSTYYSNVGYAVLSETNPSTEVGPQVITGNLAYANSGSSNHANVFIVGTVWEDTNGNQQYDPGEGLAGVTVMPDNGTYYAVTGAGGGYSIPVGAGTYSVTFSGGELVGAYARTVGVGSVSVLQDLEYFSAGDSSLNPGTWSGSSVAAGGSSDGGGGGGGGGGGCFVTAAGADAPGSSALLALVAAMGGLAALTFGQVRRTSTVQ